MHNTSLLFHVQICLYLNLHSYSELNKCISKEREILMLNEHLYGKKMSTTT